MALHAFPFYLSYFIYSYQHTGAVAIQALLLIYGIGILHEPKEKKKNTLINFSLPIFSCHV